MSTAASTAADEAIAGLQPPSLWHFFRDLTQIPRPSKQEHKVLQYLKEYATARQLAWQQDAVGNLVIRRPGTGGGEGAPTVVLQGHIDMVCEKDPAVQHDFTTDPLTLVREGDWLKARGTTLGADNGIGVAAALALLDLPATAKLPPLEALFTVDEETGLTGAYQIAPDLVQGRTMLNLDTEDWGEVFIGCAGGGDMNLTCEVHLQPLTPEQQHSFLPMELKLGGLLGGHSGLNIHEGRGNAVQLLGRTLAAVGAAAGPEGWRLVAATGGDKRNAIARDASATLLVAAPQQEAVRSAVSHTLDAMRSEYGGLEHGLSLTLAPAQLGQPLADAQVVAPADVDRLLALIRGLPHGPVKFSHAVPGLVETSVNMAALKPLPDAEGAGSTRHYTIITNTRSMLTPALEATRDVIAGLAHLAGCAEVHRGNAYPGWEPNLKSDVLQVTLDEYGRMLGGGRTAKVGAIHAGLECGILGQRFPGMDMVSFGPTIKGAHSPEERVQISTVTPFWELTLNILARLADARK